MEKKKNNKSLQKNNSFWNKTLAWINENQRLLIGFGIGLLLGLFIMIVTEDEEIATLKDGTQPVVTLKDHTITADDLYSDMKNYYGVNILVNTIDKLILDEKYPETNEMLKELETTAERWYQTYETYYQTSKEDFLANNGFKSHKDFIEYLKLDYRRNEEVENYIKNEITDKEIQEYYDKEVYGDVNTKHMLVKPDTNDKMTDEEKENKKKEALNLAKEIIAKLNTGKSFDEVKEEYKDKITYEELSFQSYNANLDKAYLNEMKNLEVNTYSKTPVESSYGYHIVYKIAQKEKPSLEDVKSDILDTLYEQKIQKNSKLYTVTLFNIREKNELKFELTKFDVPFVYPYLTRDERVGYELEKSGLLIIRYWESLPKDFPEYDFYKYLIPIPLN